MRFNDYNLRLKLSLFHPNLFNLKIIVVPSGYSRLGNRPQARQKDRKRKKKQSERQQKRPKAGHRKPHPRQIRSPKPEYLCKSTSETCIYTVYHTLSLSQTVNQSEANGFTFGAQNGDDRPGTENGTAENGKRQASGPRKYPLRTASRIYLKEKRDTS